ncbi:MAG: FAD-binding protein [Calditrichaeota bacterium]|nr:MAG: FAD-binding protein [Calditrichota bacterium]
MIKIVEIKCTPAEERDDTAIQQLAAAASGVGIEDIDTVQKLRRSIDARSKWPQYVLRLQVFIGEEPKPEPCFLSGLAPVDSGKKVVIVGAGPAGYFAALELIKAKIKPVVLDRGKDVQTRRRDLRLIQQHSLVNPDSNYCFGEGGAGTYSDGKLYTGSKKRGPVKDILQILVEHGANPEILFDAHPHIGSNRLPEIIAAIRETIQKFGGEIHFESKVTDFLIENNLCKGVVANNDVEYTGDAVILATGHSARDIFHLLEKKKIQIQAKPFAMGIRVEHPQAIIDQMQYHQNPRNPLLPAASYKIVTHKDGRAVFSFCMCPGGLIVPAATAPGEIVLNGMSMAKRDSRFANSGIVVAIEPEDAVQFAEYGELRCLYYQRDLEQKIFKAGDGSQRAPAQRMPDFVEGKLSSDLAPASYIPGIYSAPLQEMLPKHISQRLQSAFQEFGKKYRGYFTAEANLVGVESRTSSPIRIPRDREKFTHVDIAKLYPAGEGAGYAGGIVSAALDGQAVARALVVNEY